MTRQTIIVVMSVMVFGCSHTRQFTSYDEINSRAKGKLAKIELAQGVNIRGRDIQITPDSTYWIETRKLLKHAVPTSQVHKIVIVDRGRGAWEGFLGFVAAGAVMSVFEFMRGDDPPGLFSFTAEEKFILVNAMGIMFGVRLGPPLGALIGSKDVYVLNEAGASGSEPLTEGKGRSDPTRNGATQLRAPHPDSEQKTLSASFVFATTSSGPAKDLENAMTDAGYNESSYGFFSGETISHPLSRTGFGTTGFP
ncbi:MAG: hypothetical protein GH143_00025 [Calditrichaeota bacterium]|nr:hypothetical protein [Calditrichota bacterium]